MIKKLPILISLLLSSISILAQSYHSPCGTTGELAEMVTERLLQNKEAFKNGTIQFRDEITYVPIKFHLVGKNDGSGRILERYVLDQLCALNADYVDMDIQFYIKGGTFSYPNNTAIYQNHATAIETIMRPFFRDAAAINIWIVFDATPPGDDAIGTTLGYYFPAAIYDWIVIRKDQVSDDNSTLPHEMGHFLSLPHPHNGWDSEPWESNPTPVNSPGGVPTELADGSNCEDAGDYICDTPADYNGFGWPNCNFTGGAQDPNGEVIDPDENLFMGYYLNCPRDDYYFSEMQKNMMITDLGTGQRNYVTPDFTPNLTEITGISEALSPIGGPSNVVEGYNAVNFQWTAVEGADYYLLEIGTSAIGDPIFSIPVSGTNKVFDELNDNTTYYWSVRPYNDYHTCAEPSETASFKTGLSTSTNTITTVTNWSVNPNPVNIGQELFVDIRSTTSFEADLQLFTLAGAVVRSTNSVKVEAGSNRIPVNINGLSSGVYLLNIQGEYGKLVEKIVISR